MPLPAIQRPNGSTYRPRRLRSVILGDEDEVQGIAVFGTHDLLEAASIARLDLRAFNAEWRCCHLDPTYVLVDSSGQRAWWSRYLVGFEDGQPRYYHRVDNERGWAVVHFVVELLDMPPGLDD